MNGTTICGAEAARLKALFSANLPLEEIRTTLNHEFNVRRAPNTIGRFIKHEGMRNGRTRRTPEIDARMKHLFSKGVQADHVSAMLRKEFGLHLSPAGVRSAWWKMGLRRPRPEMPERWRGKLAIPKNIHPLVRRLFEEMNRQMTTMSEVEARSGVVRAAISSWRRDRVPHMVNFEAVLNVLDLELVIQPRKEP